jgi:hypothetical protein
MQKKQIITSYIIDGVKYELPSLPNIDNDKLDSLSKQASTYLELYNILKFEHYLDKASNCLELYKELKKAS